jgi:hypothetical protein
MKAALAGEGPALVHAKVALGADAALGRPTVTPVQVKEQFIECLKATAS